MVANWKKVLTFFYFFSPFFFSSPLFFLFFLLLFLSSSGLVSDVAVGADKLALLHHDLSWPFVIDRRRRRRRFAAAVQEQQQTRVEIHLCLFFSRHVFFCFLILLFWYCSVFYIFERWRRIWRFFFTHKNMSSAAVADGDGFDMIFHRLWVFF